MGESGVGVIEETIAVQFAKYKMRESGELERLIFIRKVQNEGVWGWNH